MTVGGVHRRTWKWWDRLLMPPKKIRPMGLINVQLAINPFELYWLVAICIIGVLYAAGLKPPSSVQQLLPEWAVTLWAANLAVGGLTALIGGFWRKQLDNGLVAYQFGWGLVGIGTLIYGLALLILHPAAGAYPAASNILWALACFTRVVQVQRFFRLSDRLLRRRFLVRAGDTWSVTGDDDESEETP